MSDSIITFRTSPDEEPSYLETPASLRSSFSVQEGSVAAKIRAFQDQDTDVATPSKSPQTRKAPRKLNPELLKFLDKQQPSAPQSSPHEYKPVPQTISDPLKRPTNQDRIEQDTGSSQDRSTEHFGLNSEDTDGYVFDGKAKSLVLPERFVVHPKEESPVSGGPPAGRRQPKPTNLEIKTHNLKPKPMVAKTQQQPGSSLASGHGLEQLPDNPSRSPMTLEGYSEDPRGISPRFILHKRKIASQGLTEDDSEARDGTSDRTATQADHALRGKSEGRGDSNSEHHEEDAKRPPPMYKVRQHQIKLESPQPKAVVQATFLRDPEPQDDICLDQDHSSKIHDQFVYQESDYGRRVNSKGPRKDQDGVKEKTHYDRGFEVDHGSPGTAQIGHNRRSRKESKTLIEIPDERFDVFVRERTTDIALKVPVYAVSTESATATASNGCPDAPLPSEPEFVMQTAPPKQRRWRWWKLVMNEKEPPEDQSANASESSGWMKTTWSQKHSGAAAEGSDSDSSNGLGNIDDNAPNGSLSTQMSTNQSRRESFQPAHLRGVPDTVHTRLPSRGIDGFRVHDAFGHGVMIDDQELPVEALERLSSLDNFGEPPDSSSGVHDRRKPSARGRDSLADKIHVPVGAIAPILQNDGTASRRRSSLTVSTAQNRHGVASVPREVARNVTNAHVGDLGDGTDESAHKTCKIALENEGRRTTVNVAEEQDAKGKKIVVTVEDGVKKVLRVEIFPGRGTAVVEGAA